MSKSKIQRLKSQEIWVTVTSVNADGSENVLLNFKPDNTSIDSKSGIFLKAIKSAESPALSFAETEPVEVGKEIAGYLKAYEGKGGRV